MPETNEEIENRIAEACKAVEGLSLVNIRRLSRDFNVPYQRLLGRLKGAKPLVEAKRRFKEKRLTDTQEAAIIQWIRAQCAAGQLPTAANINEAANRMIEQAPRNGIRTPVTKSWAKHFIAAKLPKDMVFGYPKSSYSVQSRAEASSMASSGANSSVEDAGIKYSGETCQRTGPLSKWARAVKVVSFIDPSLVSKPPPAPSPRPLKRGRRPRGVSIIDTSPASNPLLVPEASIVSNPSTASNPPLKREGQSKPVLGVHSSPTSIPSLVPDPSPISKLSPISNVQASEPPKSASPMPSYTGERYISPLDDPKIRFGQDWRLMRQKYRENRELMERARWDCDAMEQVLRTHRQLESPEPEDIKVDLFAGLKV